MIVTVTPAPALDRTYHTDGFEVGAVNRARASSLEASGKGVNVSRALSAAGVATLAVLPLGGAEGQQLEQLLAAESVPCQAVSTDVTTRTNITLAVAGGATATTKVNAPAPALPESVWAELLDIVATALTEQSGSWVVCSGSVPADAQDIPARLVALAREHGARSAVDSSGSALASAIAGRPDLIAPNHLELAELVGADPRTLEPDGRASPAADSGALVRLTAGWALELAARTRGSVLATLGASGAVFADATGSWHAAAPPIVAVNTVGAGDALLAGYLSVVDAPGDRHGSAHPADPGGAVATAVAWGTSACLMAGTSGNVAEGADVDAVLLTRLS